MKRLIKEYPNFLLYEYIFDNGNSYRECKPKWKQKDFSHNLSQTPEEKIEKKLGNLIYKK